MYAPIGRGFRDTKAKVGAMAAGAVAVAVNLVSLANDVYSSILMFGAFIACLAIYGLIGGWNPVHLGLVLTPRQSVGYWCKTTLVIGAVMAGWLVVAGGVLAWTGHLSGFAGHPLGDVLHELFPMCLSAPVFEEVVFRFALCVPAMALLGPRWAIVLSGVVFALFHVVGGVASPDNVVAGFLLGWAFLKSGSISVPIVLHALGNFCVLAIQYGVWVYNHGIANSGAVLH